MPSHENTPFIPPLTFTPSPQPSAVPPLLPSQPAAANTPPWANQPTTPAHFPHYGSPYAGTPFVPPNIINSPGYMPGSYHPAPTHLPPAAGAPPPAGVSSDWHGYPPAAAAGPPPWANTWAVPPTGYNTFTQPLSPLLYPDGTPWSGAVPPSVLTAAGFGLGAPMHGTWPPGYGPPGSVPASAVPTAPQRPPPELDGPRNRRGLGEDLPIRHFAAGRHYGPVLDVTTLHIVKARPIINPLLRPPPEDDAHAVLEWNMLFPSRACRRSSDPSHRSWMDGRDEPATFPRVEELRVFTRALSWEAKITARDREVGVTCADVIEGLDAFLHLPTTSAEFSAQPSARQRELSQAYWANRSTAEGVPGGALGRGSLRLDWLCDKVMYGGLIRNDSYSKQVYGGVVPNLFEWKCVQRYMRPEDHGLAGRMAELGVDSDTGDSPNLDGHVSPPSDASFSSSERSAGRSRSRARDAPEGTGRAAAAAAHGRAQRAHHESFSRADEMRGRLDHTRRMEDAARLSLQQEEELEAERLQAEQERRVLQARKAEERAKRLAQAAQAEAAEANAKSRGRERRKSLVPPARGASRGDSIPIKSAGMATPSTPWTGAARESYRFAAAAPASRSLSQSAARHQEIDQRGLR